VNKSLTKNSDMKADSCSSVVIVGIVKNIESTINDDYKRLTKAFSRFEKIDFFVVESGSDDNSVQVLDELSKTQTNFSFLHLETSPSLSRTSNMAMARNAYLSYLREGSILSKYKYVVIADFNKLNNKLNRDSINSCWTVDSWDVVTANQSGRYYDIWALRHPIWSPNDCWEAVAFYRKYFKFPELALGYVLRARSIRIPRGSEWIEVESAFGGLAIYRSEILNSNAIYEGICTDGKVICEHVPFHNRLRLNGARIYINPAMINARITDHTRRLSIFFTILRIGRYPLKIIAKRINRN